MLPDRIFSTFQTASQGMAVQREKISAASQNIANASTSAPEGSPDVYRPQSVQGSIGNRQDFQRMLLDNVSSLRTTNPGHLSRPGVATSSHFPGSPSGLGPQAHISQADSFRHEYDPNHPDADENGMVRYPDIDLIKEMTQMVSANRLYEANLSAIEAEKQIIKRSLEI
ncbi:flagellar basal body rod C-terminal domain-containing protein [Balneolaceae bacterium ANBcel3]|nr:flagellar basal body rod C-terminal domain-containing protein [Balneolaceae bacterium ANBcel3]